MMNSALSKLVINPHTWVLPTDPGTMDQRILRRVSLSEFFGLLFSLAFIGIFTWLIHIKAGYPADFEYYLVGRSSSLFYYGYWILPFLGLLKLLPFSIAYIGWCIINLISVLFSVRVFGGKPLLVLLSYQLLSIFYYGQISGVLAGSLALLWWGITHRKWYIAGIGLLLASTKYQVGGTLGLLLLWYGIEHWRDFLKILIIPVLVSGLTLLVYPGWPLEVYSRISEFPYIHLGITFWNFIGAWSLLFWLPALILPMTKPQRFLALFSLSAFAVPYFSQIDLVTLFSFPIGLLPLFGWISGFFPIWGMTPIYFVAAVPFICYLFVVFPSAIILLKLTKASFQRILKTTKS